MATFEELGFKNEILKAVSDMGFVEAMPIQEKVTPFLLSDDDRDLVALAQTGTGKTAGFGLPVLQLTDDSRNQIQTLILAPTRELCVQISNDLKNFAKYTKVKVVPVYGGESIIRQFKDLDVQPQILVATPGRLIDLIDRKKVHLENVKFLVLDEADEMLNMGFKDDIERIFSEIPEDHRTLLFSATMPKEIANIAKNYMKNHVEIAIGKKNSGSENVSHIYYMVAAKNRYACLKRVVDLNPDIYGIVFCRTRQETKDIAEALMKDGYNADALHGDLSQAQRDAVMQKFRIKNLQLLVATDVAARGLDVNNLTHVINYCLPDDVESYTHRSGRTGRAGRTGVSISILHLREKSKIREIEKIIGKEFEKKDVPSGIEVCSAQLKSILNKLKTVEINEDQVSQYLDMAYTELDGMSREDIIKHFVSLQFNQFIEYYKDAEDINISERPERGERGGRDRKGRRGDDGFEGKEKKGLRGGYTRPDHTRLKINKGENAGFTPKKVLGLINDTVNDKKISIRDIEITPRYTFFDVPNSHVQKMFKAFNEVHKGKDIVLAEVQGEQRGRSRNSERREKDFGKEFGGKRRRGGDDDWATQKPRHGKGAPTDNRKHKKEGQRRNKYN
ncbi:MAG: DEAD/DEAH box helicase [Paludibacteraceae bacterium]|nr:DEAD/DEAH box helicase [Paludibacteraceae bacterium]